MAESSAAFSSATPWDEHDRIQQPLWKLQYLCNVSGGKESGSGGLSLLFVGGKGGRLADNYISSNNLI